MDEVRDSVSFDPLGCVQGPHLGFDKRTFLYYLIVHNNNKMLWLPKICLQAAKTKSIERCWYIDMNIGRQLVFIVGQTFNAKPITSFFGIDID